MFLCHPTHVRVRMFACERLCQACVLCFRLKSLLLAQEVHVAAGARFRSVARAQVITTQHARTHARARARTTHVS